MKTYYIVQEKDGIGGVCHRAYGSKLSFFSRTSNRQHYIMGWPRVLYRKAEENFEIFKV